MIVGMKMEHKVRSKTIEIATITHKQSAAQ